MAFNACEALFLLSMSYSLLSYITGGLYPNLPNYTPSLVGGAPIHLNPTAKLNVNEDPTAAILGPKLNLTAQQLASLKEIAQLKNPEGSIIVPTPEGYLSIDSGHIMDFDPDTLQGRITPALATDIINGQRDSLDGATETYTGADLRIMIESSEPPSNGHRYAKQLLEATTLTVSTHREIAPVRASGYISPKGFALGKRTIAGTLIVTQFTAEVLLRFLQGIMLNDGSKDTFFTKVDQLPTFNMTMIFTNESGYASCRRLIGVKFVTDGVVYSIQDMFVEQVLSWMALDFTPLMPLTMTNLYHPIDPLAKNTRREKVPTDLMKQGIIL